MKKLWQKARRRPVAALYLAAVVCFVLGLLANWLLDSLLYATGYLHEQTVTLADTGLYQLVNLEQTGTDTLVSLTGDAQLLLAPGQPIRTLRLVAVYETASSDERDLYYHLPQGGYSAAQRVWPRRTADGSGWVYTVPRRAGQNVRLDLADNAPVTIRLQAIVLNERAPFWTYFIPSLWQLFWLAAVPGLLGCGLWLWRDMRRKPRKGKTK